MKKKIRKIHLWLGLLSGLFVFIIATTGCLYAFQEEIQNYTEAYRFITPQSNDFLLPDVLQKNAIEVLPQKQLHSIKYNEKNMAAEAIFYHYEPTYYYKVYLNPYTGKVLHIQDMNKGFFAFILNGHFYLWLPPVIGQPTVAIATLIFFVMVISGIILWYPKNKNALKQRFWFRWKSTTQWKRKNYDLHSIIGFYSCLFALVFIITGLVWGFQWFAGFYYKSIGGQKSLSYEAPISNKASNLKSDNAINQVYINIKLENQNLASTEVHPPETDSSSIAVSTNKDMGTYWKTDYRYFDRYSLQEQNVNNVYGRFKDATKSDKLMRMNYDIHTGAIAGLAGKIFVFLISLLIASLPITGVLLWFGRKKKTVNVIENRNTKFD